MQPSSVRVGESYRVEFFGGLEKQWTYRADVTHAGATESHELSGYEDGSTSLTLRADTAGAGRVTLLRVRGDETWARARCSFEVIEDSKPAMDAATGPDGGRMGANPDGGTSFDGTVGSDGGVADGGSGYDTITVPSNEQHVVTVGDNDTYENKIIDITNPGATYRIEAYGSDWTVRNIGIKGVWDVASDGHQQSISCRVDSGTGTIENFYFADGVADDTFPGVTGIYVQKAHSGTLNIKNVNIQECPNNGIYASNPGAPDGGKGVVNVEDSYFSNNLAASVRLGTDGSTARNCVVNGGPHRGFWVYWESVTFDNCDAIATNPWDAGGTAYDYQSTAYGELVDSRGEGTIRERGGGEIVGTMNPDPRTSPPAGVPTTPVEAASGATSGS